MIKKKIFIRNDLINSCILFIGTLFLSRINIPLITSSGLMPDYFLALFVALIAARFMNMNLYILFFLGLVVDLLAGQLIGQYALIFIVIYFINFLLNKYFVFKAPVMLVAQHLILITISIIILLISSLSYELDINMEVFIFKWIITCLAGLLYQKLIQFLINKS